MASGEKRSSSKGRSAGGDRVAFRESPTRATRKSVPESVQHYAICVCNDDYPASLELRKLYPVIDDSFAAQHGMVRVIDESGEDYLYPADFFLRVELPASIARTLAKIA
jgi:hypothetical protein